MSKISVLPVVEGHLATLYDQRTQKTSPVDVATFFGLPGALAVVLVAMKFGYRVDAVNGFLNAFAILTGLLLNLLILVFTLASTTSVTKMDPRKRRDLLREIFANVCYCIVIAVGVVVSAVTALSYMRSTQGAVSGPIATFLLTFLGLSFVLTLLMIVKRMYILMNKELEIANYHQEG